MLEIRSGQEMGGLKSSLTIVKYADMETHPDIKNTIGQARKSKYAFWGNVPVWDSYDRPPYDTTQYIAEIKYQKPGDLEMRREIASFRLVPTTTEAPYSEDVLFYRAGDRPLFNVIKERLGFCSDEECAGKLASGSRISAIRPEGERSNAFAILAIAQIVIQMTADAKRSGIEWITYQMRPEFLHKVLSLENNTLNFSSAEETLGLPAGTISLDRKNPDVWNEMVSWPGYFFNTEDLASLIIDLVQTGRLDADILKSLDIVPSDLTKPKNIKKLSPLTKGNGIISNDLTCEEFRMLLKENVRDGTVTSLVTVDSLRKSAEAIIKKAREVYGK